MITSHLMNTCGKNIVGENGSNCKVIGNDNFTFDEKYAAKIPGEPEKSSHF